MRLRLGLRRRLRWGSLQRSPDPLVIFGRGKGVRKVGEGKEWGKEGNGGESQTPYGLKHYGGSQK